MTGTHGKRDCGRRGSETKNYGEKRGGEHGEPVQKRRETPPGKEISEKMARRKTPPQDERRRSLRKTPPRNERTRSLRKTPPGEVIGDKDRVSKRLRLKRFSGRWTDDRKKAEPGSTRRKNDAETMDSTRSNKRRDTTESEWIDDERTMTDEN